MTVTIRAARPRDLPGVYDVLDAAFDAPLQLFVDQTEGDTTLRWRQMRIAEERGRVVAHVRIFARTMMLRGVPIRAGGIGSVAALPDARGSGYPSALLMDAVDVMDRDRMPLAFLFTGIPQFYERLGWRTVLQPGFRVDARAIAALPRDAAASILPVTDDDIPALVALHRRAISGTTGAIRRTARTWRDAQRWVREDAAGCLLATHAGRMVAYIRTRTADYGFQVLDAEYAAGHDAAMTTLVAEAAARVAPDLARGRSHASPVPTDHAIAAAYRSLRSTVESTDTTYPMMMRIVSLDGALRVLLPQLRLRAAAHPGEAFALRLHGPDGDGATLDVRRSGIRLTRGSAPYALDAAATLDALLGQRRVSALVRPRPPVAIRRRIDALLPEAALHFWNADRI